MDITNAIAQVIASGDASQLTGSGKPKTEAIDAITGGKITAAERDAAFAEYTASSRDSIAGSSDQAEATGEATTDVTTATPDSPSSRGLTTGSTEQPAATEPALIISTVKGVKSFRRAGIAFTSAPVTVLLRDLTAAQIEALKAEKMLNVQETAGN